LRSKFEYLRPDTLSEALTFLDEYGKETALLAGGTDLMIKIRSGELSARFVLDVSRIEELRQVKQTSDSLNIGSAVTYSEIIDHPSVAACAPALAGAAANVGSLQIRNVGTLGGNVANASPAADSVPAMMVHNTWVKIRNASSTRLEPLSDVIVAPYKTNLRPNELIISLILEPLPETFRWSFQRIARRQALSIARVNAAVTGGKDRSGLIAEVRISAGSITPSPARQTLAEDYLTGKTPNLKNFMEAAHLASQEMIRLSGIRSSTQYKKPAVEGLILKCLMEVFLNEP
jgi:CO/xanthine dehydrogenase FAD-binding subunit